MTVCLCDYSIIIAIASSVVHYNTAELCSFEFLRTIIITLVYADLLYVCYVASH